MLRTLMNCLVCAAVAGAVMVSVSGRDLRNSPPGPWRLCTGPTGCQVVETSWHATCRYRNGGTYLTKRLACDAAHNADNAPYCGGITYGCDLPK
jgi:hypothetical protein